MYFCFENHNKERNSVRWIANKFGESICGTKTIKHSDFGDHLTQIFRLIVDELS